MDDKEVAPSEGSRAATSVKSAVRQVGGATLPLEVGTVALGADGHFHCSQEDRPLHFRFSACGVLFEADIASRTAPLRLRANLGKLPYSTESPAARSLVRDVLAATGRLRRGQILLSPEHDLMLEGELTPPSPRTPASVIATATALVLGFQPYLDLLGEALTIRRPPPLPEDEAAPAEA